MLFLVPIATNLEDSNDIREKYFEIIIERLESLTGQKLKENIILKPVIALMILKKITIRMVVMPMD